MLKEQFEVVIKGLNDNVLTSYKVDQYHSEDWVVCELTKWKELTDYSVSLSVNKSYKLQEEVPEKKYPKFHLISSESGDWEILALNGEIMAEGHSLDSTEILEKLIDARIASGSLEQVTISDELMESMNQSVLDDITKD